jgi:hypothetical protein
MIKLLSVAVMLALVTLVAAPSAHTYTAMKYTTTTYSLATPACLPQTCVPAQQPMIGQAYGYPQPMPYPYPPRKVAKCKAPSCNSCAPCMPPCGPACGPVPCGGYVPQCGPAPCPPPCNPQSAWDRLITNLWY